MRDNLYRHSADYARLDELFYDYNQFTQTMNDTLAVMGEDKFLAVNVLNEKSYAWLMRTYGDFETSYMDLIAGRNEATMFLASRYKQFLEKLNLYNMDFDELNAMNNQEVRDYMGSYAQTAPDATTDNQNVGIQNIRVMNSKQISLALAKTNWKHPWMIMIQDWISDIMNVYQTPQPTLPRRR